MGLLDRGRGFGYYAFEPRDPYWVISPAHPFDAAHVLSRIDTETRSAAPVLRQMAKDAGHPGRLAAALSLWRSGSESPDLMPAFRAALEAHAAQPRNDFSPLPREARECLAELGRGLKPALGSIAKWLKRQEAHAGVEDQVAVLEALGGLGADARAVAGLLRPMLRGNRWDAKRRVAAAVALYRITGEKGSTFTALGEVLLGQEEHASIYYRPDRTVSARVHAARALGVLAEKGDERAAALIADAARGDENAHVRVAALEALARQRDGNAAAIKGLCAALRHEADTVRIAAAAALGRLGPLAKAAAKPLGAAVDDGELAVRQAVREALKALE